MKIVWILVVLLHCPVFAEGQGGLARVGGFGVAGEHFVADAAVEAFARLAVLAAQLQQSLRRERVVTLHPMFHKQRHHRVILRSQRMKHLHRGIAHRRVARSRAVGVEQRDHGVDCQHIHRISPERHRLRAFQHGVKCVVGAPIAD